MNTLDKFDRVALIIINIFLMNRFDDLVTYLTI